jgi:hypothetical protein
LDTLFVNPHLASRTGEDQSAITAMSRPPGYLLRHLQRIWTDIGLSEVNFGEKNEDIAGTDHRTFIYLIYHLHAGTEKSGETCRYPRNHGE